MIDYGLLASVLVGFAVPGLLARAWPLENFHEGASFVDAVAGPAMMGLVAGRLATLMIDDPRALGKLSDMLVIRSGVEFWPGLAVAVLAVGWRAKRSGVAPLRRLAAIAPLCLVGYGAYEATCVFRGGCYGPPSPVGLRPPGLSTVMLPVGILMGVAVILGASLVRRSAQCGASPMVQVAIPVGVVATVRGIASFWLPRVGDGLTRQHRSSVVVSFAVTAVLIALLVIRFARPTPAVAS